VTLVERDLEAIVLRIERLGGAEALDLKRPRPERAQRLLDLSRQLGIAAGRRQFALERVRIQLTPDRPLSQRLGTQVGRSDERKIEAWERTLAADGGCRPAEEATGVMAGVIPLTGIADDRADAGLAQLP